MKNTILYDGRCGFCLKWMKRIRKLDFNKKFKWVNAFDPKATKHIQRLPKLKDMQKDIHFIRGTTIFKGFAAWREILRLMPLTWLLAMVLYIPSFAQIGKKFYRHTADNRYRN